MKNRVFKILLSLILIIPCLLSFQGCGKKKEYICMLGDFALIKANVFMLPDMDSTVYNIEIGLENKSSETKEFDFSTLTIEVEGEQIESCLFNSKKEYTAGQYMAYSCQLESTEHLQLGKKVIIFWNDDRVAETTISEW